MTKNEESILAYQVAELIKKYEQSCIDMKAIFDKIDERITTVENRVTWIYGLLAGLGVVSIATLIKMFL